mmetsp:Transcript_45429/g.96611  ORF Transcript_45429/g.96611 Transcript_45429/m.96611 type:complete len:103 (-) Transcript_45429:119-427(-)
MGDAFVRFLLSCGIAASGPNIRQDLAQAVGALRPEVENASVIAGGLRSDRTQRQIQTAQGRPQMKALLSLDIIVIAIPDTILCSSCEIFHYAHCDGLRQSIL